MNSIDMQLLKKAHADETYEVPELYDASLLRSLLDMHSGKPLFQMKITGCFQTEW